MEMRLAINQEFRQSLENVGIDYFEIVKKANIPRLLWEDSPKLNYDEYFHLLRILDRSVTDNQILLFSDVGRLKLFVPPIFASMCSANGEQAIERLAQYKALIGPIALTININHYSTRISFHFDCPKGDISRFCVLNEQILLVSLIRKCTGKRVCPEAIYCEFEYGKELIDYVDCKIITAESNVIVFNNEDLKIPFNTKNNIMWEYLKPAFDQELKLKKDTLSFTEVLESVLINSIPSGHFSLQEVSSVMRRSCRSLQRILKSEKTTFKNEVKKAQLVIASDYLANTDLSIEELAYLLGYKNVSSFHRAFKKWTGKTVLEYKNSLYSHKTS